MWPHNNGPLPFYLWLRLCEFVGMMAKLIGHDLCVVLFFLVGVGPGLLGGCSTLCFLETWPTPHLWLLYFFPMKAPFSQLFWICKNEEYIWTWHNSCRQLKTKTEIMVFFFFFGFFKSIYNCEWCLSDSLTN